MTTRPVLSRVRRRTATVRESRRVGNRTLVGVELGVRVELDLWAENASSPADAARLISRRAYGVGRR